MLDPLLRDGGSLYAIAFFGAMMTVAMWEALAPRRLLRAPIRKRWTGNFAVYLLGSGLLQLLFPGVAIGAAVLAARHGWGLLNLVDVPPWSTIAASLILLDLGRYALHRLLHVVPVLWRVHAMHHADPDYDLTTAIRFHPFETLLYVASFCGLILLVGAPAFAVIASDTVVAASGLWVHGNVRFPVGIDRWLRLVLVTPDMHRVHHSIHERESRSNFSSVLSIWDRLFGTYIAQPAAGHEGMEIGLRGFEDREHIGIGWMLAHPFLRRPQTAVLASADAFPSRTVALEPAPVVRHPG